MSEIDRKYEARVLQMVINQYLSEAVTITKQNLESIEANKEQIVWSICTKIYHNSGHKVNLSMIRDVIDSQLDLIKNQQIEEATEQALLDHEVLTGIISQSLNITDEKADVLIKVRHIISELSYEDEEEISLETAVFKEEAFVGGGFSSEPLEPAYRYIGTNRSYRRLLCVEWGIEGVYEAEEFLFALEKEFGIEIPQSDAKYLSTVDELVNYILEKIDI